MVRILAAILFVAVLGVGFLFAWFNDGSVRLDFLAGVVQVRFAFVVFGAIALGCALGLLGGFAAFLRQRREMTRLREHSKQLEGELDSLRAAAARDPR